MYMSQMNINIRPEFARSLEEFMRLRGLTNKSEAIRVAVEEALSAARKDVQPTDFMALLGAGRVGKENPNPRFSSDDDLW